MLAKLMEPTMVMPSILVSSVRVRGDAAERDGDRGEDADDDEAEGDGGGTFCEEVGGGGHGAGAFEFQPAGGEFSGEADADAEERGADEAEAGVAAEHVLRDRHVPAMALRFDDAEEAVEHDGKADGGEREGFGAQQLRNS